MIEWISSASEFWELLTRDIAKATVRVCIQTMSFEGDSKGQELTQAFINSKASDKRLLVDSYSKVVHNDCMLVSPTSFINSALYKERFSTHLCWKTLQKNHVGVRFTNPLGFLGSKYPLRNHKKLIIVDDYIYIGGRNICDHNFIWKDMMVRIHCSSLLSILIDDFNASWEGNNQSKQFESPLVLGWVLDGIRSQCQYQTMMDMLSKATTHIDVFSPYISGPFLKALCHISQEKGIALHLYVPENNNKPVVTGYLSYFQKKYSFKLRYIQGPMTHAKAIIIDDQQLWFGSSNFDFVSYYAEQELVLVFNDRDVVTQFKVAIFSELSFVEKPYNAVSWWIRQGAYGLLTTLERGLKHYVRWVN